MPVRYILSCVWVRLSIFSQLSIIQYMGLCVFGLPISLVMIERIYTLSYYHHQIGSMNYYPLFRVRSWNNGMRCMSLYILTLAPARLEVLSHRHDDVIKWKHFSRYWPFVRGIRWSPVNSPRKGQWRGAMMFSLICAWANGWVNNRGAGDLRRHRIRYDVTVMKSMNDNDNGT